MYSYNRAPFGVGKLFEVLTKKTTLDLNGSFLSFLAAHAENAIFVPFHR